MKKLFLATAAALLAAALCACSAQKPDLPETTDTEFYEATEAQTETQVETTTEAATEPVALTDEELAPADIMSFEIEFNGKALTIPFDFSELTEFGYSIKEDDELKAQSYTIGVYPENADGESVSVQLWNPTDETKKYSECQVGQLTFRPCENYTLTLPGGLPFDGRATKEDIIAKYGEPKNTREGTGYTVLEYGIAFSGAEFMIYDDPTMKQNDSVKLQNLV